MFSLCWPIQSEQCVGGGVTFLGISHYMYMHLDELKVHSEIMAEVVLD